MWRNGDPYWIGHASPGPSAEVHETSHVPMSSKGDVVK